MCSSISSSNKWGDIIIIALVAGALAANDQWEKERGTTVPLVNIQNIQIMHESLANGHKKEEPTAKMTNIQNSWDLQKSPQRPSDVEIFYIINCLDVTILNLFWGLCLFCRSVFFAFCRFAFSSFCLFVFLSDITLIICLKGLKSQK